MLLVSAGAVPSGGAAAAAAARPFAVYSLRERNECCSWIGNASCTRPPAYAFCKLRNRKKLRARKARERATSGGAGNSSGVGTYDAATENEGNGGSEGKASQPRKDSKVELQKAEDSSKKPFSLEDLLLMIREAEKNVLLLNQVRARTLEDLEITRREKESLQCEVKGLQKKWAEAGAKIKLAEQESLKNQLLEKEVQALQEKLKERDASKAANAIHGGHGVKVGKFEEEVESFKASLSDLKVKDELLSRLQTDRTTLQEKLQALELRLEQNTVSLQELGEAKTENEALKEEIRKLQIELKVAELAATPDDTKTTSENSSERLLSENLMLQEQVKKLLIQESRSKDLLEEAACVNKALKEQVDLLQNKLLESDAEIRSQLQAYQAEVESFQSSLQQLTSEQRSLPSLQVPIGDMPWEFWSTLLLRIDAWVLERALSSEAGEKLRMMVWQRDIRIRDLYVEMKDRSGEDFLAGVLELVKVNRRLGLYVVHIAAEMAPVAKVGGLADVVTGLSRALQRKEHLVEIILPKYDCIDYDGVKNLQLVDTEIHSFFDNQLFKNKIWLGTVEDLPVYFIEPFHPGNFFCRKTFYGERDDFRRFLYFSRAALEFLFQSNKRPDIIHSHDWTTAAVAPMYWDLYVPQGFNSARLVFTCHNFEYQGTESPSALAACGLNVQGQFRQDRMQDSFMHGRVNLLKGGIVFSNIVTTVSPTYAQEVRSPEGGRGLQVALSVHSNKFYGVLNGIDVDAWDPSRDPSLDFRYSPEDLTGKAANKVALQRRLKLAVEPRKPLVGCVTRLVPQKGVQLIRHAIYRTLEKGGQFVLLGTSPVMDIQRDFERLSRKFEEHPDIRLVLKYDEPLAHSIYAASDVFTIPSIFEPCGLTQMIAMRYGTIPVVRRTGGLNDSVYDVDDESVPLDKRNGFSFSSAEAEAMNYALDRALEYYQSKQDWWDELVRKAMRIDFSWDASADQYIELYEQAIARARARAAAAAAAS